MRASSAPGSGEFGSRAVKEPLSRRAVVARVAAAESGNDATSVEWILCARDTTGAFHTAHCSQLPCERGTAVFTISQMRNKGTQIK